MLRLFFNKDEHPLSDAREVKRICVVLSKLDPMGAIEEACAWLESLEAVEDFKLAVRIERVMQLDETAAPQARRLGREFLKPGTGNRQAENRLWDINRGYWHQLVVTYDACLNRFVAGEKESDAARPLLNQMYIRQLHARAALLKWDQFHYGPVAGEFWSALGQIYLAAEGEKFLQKQLPIYPGWANTSVEAEYLKALMFQASSMDKLLPVQIELAERLIAHFLPRFTLTREVRPENVYWVDASLPVPPTRLAKLPEITPALRFFNGGAALEAIEALQARIAADHRVPAEINLSGQYEVEDVGAVLGHLAMCWAPKPPMRKDVRHRIKSRLIVAHGIKDVHGYVSGRMADHTGVEAWVVDDVSLGGMGALVPINRRDWIRIGVLVAMQPDGGDNWLLGVVRRFARTSNSEGQVGIETLSKTPVTVVATDLGGIPTEAIVLDVPEVGADARMLLPLAALQKNVALLFSMNGKHARFHPREIIETGEDFVIANFFVQSYS